MSGSFAHHSNAVMCMREKQLEAVNVIVMCEATSLLAVCAKSSYQHTAQ